MVIIFKNPHCEVRSNFDVMLTDDIFEVAETQTTNLAEASDKIIEYRITAITDALINLSTWFPFSFVGGGKLLLKIGCSTPLVHLCYRFMPQSPKDIS